MESIALGVKILNLHAVCQHGLGNIVLAIPKSETERGPERLCGRTTNLFVSYQ